MVIKNKTSLNKIKLLNICQEKRNIFNMPSDLLIYLGYQII